MHGVHQTHLHHVVRPTAKDPNATITYLRGVPPFVEGRLEERLDVGLRRPRSRVWRVDEDQLGHVLQPLVQPAALELREHGLTISRRTERYGLLSARCAVRQAPKRVMILLACGLRYLVLENGCARAEAVKAQQAQARHRRALRRLRHAG